MVVTRKIGAVQYSIETEREAEGRWIAEVMELPGAMVYGTTRENAITKVLALAEDVIAERELD